MFRNILVAVDGSSAALRALEAAVDLAQTNRSRLTVMTCVPDTSTWLIGAGGVTVDLERLAREADAEYAALLDAAVDMVPLDVPTTKVLAHGRVAPALVEQVQSGSHDLLVVGSRGRGAGRSILLGSVSHQVVQTAGTAVLVIHGPPDED